MSKRSFNPVLALLGLVALTFIALLFYLLSGDPGRSPVIEVPAETVEASAPTAELAQEDLTANEGAAPEREEASAEEDEADVEEPPLAEDDVAWIEGRVLFSSDTPSDEEAYVISIDRERTLPALYYTEGPARAAWEGTHEGGLLDSARVDAAGRFRVKASRSSGRAILAVSGRYSYSKASRTFDLEDEEDDVILDTELGALVSGTVLRDSDDGVEVKGTEVGIGPDVSTAFNALEIGRRALSMGVEVEEDGYFEFRAIPTGMSMGIVLQHPERAAQLHRAVRLAPGEHTVMDLPFTQGARLRGHVVDAAGEPVADAEVKARVAGPFGDGIGTVREARTAADGSFALDAVMTELIELRCQPEGERLGKLRLPEKLAEGQLLEGLVLEIPASKTLKGTVLFPDGASAEGAPVSVRRDISKMDPGMMGGGVDLGQQGSAETDAYGAFVVKGLGEGPFALSVDHEVEEGEHAGVWRARLLEVEGGARGLVLELEGTTSLHGRVVGASGEPLEAFDVRATLQGSGAAFGIGAEHRGESFEERVDGTFELDGLVEGTWEVVVSAEGHAESEVAELTLPEAPNAEAFVFTLIPSATARGRVLDPEGREIGGAIVGLELKLAERMAMARRGDLPEAISDHEGRFELSGLAPGEVELVAQLEGFASSEPVSVTLVSGEVSQEMTLELRIGALLTGEVLGDDGEPAPGRSIIVQRMPSWNRQFMMTSDARGEFRFEHLEPGQWQLISMPNVLTGEFQPAEMENVGEMLGSMEIEIVELTDGEETHVTLGEPPEDPVKLVAHVTHAGSPVEDAVVSLVPDGASGFGDMSMAVTDEEGRIEVELEKRGDYLVTVQNDVGTGRQNSIEFHERIPEEGDAHELELALPLGRISGHVEAADGSPAADCRITLNVEGGVAYGSFLGGHYAELTTDSEGNYDIPYLRPGTYTVSAGGAFMAGMFGDSGEVTGRTVQSGLRVREGDWLQGIDFELSRPGRLKGKVQDAAGLPVSGAAVWVRDEAGHVLERFALVETDAAGGFEYAGLGPGRYTIFAKKEGRVSPPSAPVMLTEGGRAEAVAVLDEGTTLIVTVTDKSGAEIRARISVVDGDGNEMSGLYSLTEIMSQFGRGFSAKEQRVGPLPPGRYRVTATLDDGRETHKNLTLSGRDERKLKLRFR